LEPKTKIETSQRVCWYMFTVTMVYKVRLGGNFR